MRKYLVLLSISWQNGFAYRASVFLWRFRQFLSSFFSLTLWTILYQSTENSFGYSEDQMIAYIFITGVIQNLIVATALNGLTSTIYSGELSIFLVKPIGLFRALAVSEVADKAKNLFFVIIESMILFAIFQPHFISIQPLHFLLGMGWILGGIGLTFFISLLFGAIGFWSPESWGPRFLFFTFIYFIGGKFFPLDLLPNLVQKLVWLTPFPFLSYAQSQLLLNRLSATEILIGSLVLLLWLGLLGGLTKLIWKIGLKDYAAMGQ